MRPSGVRLEPVSKPKATKARTNSQKPEGETWEETMLKKRKPHSSGGFQIGRENGGMRALDD